MFIIHYSHLFLSRIPLNKGKTIRNTLRDVGLHAESLKKRYTELNGNLEPLTNYLDVTINSTRNF